MSRHLVGWVEATWTEYEVAQQLTEFGIAVSEFGAIPLFHAGCQRIGDFLEHLVDGAVINRCTS